MSNMSYCRFRNTLGDLGDCAEGLDMGDCEDLCEEESRAKTRLIELCQRIAEGYGDDDA
jgi:hypothetical protein